MILWTSDKDFQIKSITHIPGSAGNPFDFTPPYPDTPQKEVPSGFVRGDAVPADGTKCYQFRAHFVVTDAHGNKQDKDPHVFTTMGGTN
jgi:hypothetical protein